MHPIRGSSAILAAIVVAMTTVAAQPAYPAPAPAAGPLTARSGRVDTGRLIALPTLGGWASFAGAMNQRGDLVGNAADAEGNTRGVVWWHGQARATALGVDRGFPFLINDKRHIVGAIFPEDGTTTPFLWRAGHVTYLRAPAGVTLLAGGLNNRDQVIGSALLKDTERAFLWQNGHLTLLPTPKGMRSYAVGINNRGEVLGTVHRLRDGFSRAVLWRGGRMTWIGTESDAPTNPVAINDLGQVIGSRIDGEHPFLWQRGRMTDLLAGTTATAGSARAINDTGMIAGSVTASGGDRQAVLWRSGRMVPLGLPSPLLEVRAINDRGDVAGEVLTEDGFSEFRWRLGHTTLFAEPFPALWRETIGIDRSGTIVVVLEDGRLGFKSYRSA